MKRPWNELQLAFYVPEELRRRIGQTPVYQAAKVLKYSSVTTLLFGLLIAVVALVMLGLALGGVAKQSGWSVSVLRAAIGLLLGWLAWRLLAFWHRQKRSREACDRAYREDGARCDARVVYFEERNSPGEEYKPTWFLYYKFRDDFIIQERMYDSIPSSPAKEGDLVEVQHLLQEPRLARLASRK
jgi:hypothetical protein